MSIELPAPDFSSADPLNQIIERRRSYRDFSSRAITLEQIAAVLWSAQAVTGSEGKRVVPSAGAQYPLQLYLVAAAVDGLVEGCFQYQPANHQLKLLTNGDLRSSMTQAALDQQPWVGQATAILVVTADFGAMREHFMHQPPEGERGDRYIYIESGAVVQNVSLQAENLNLGTVLVGGFNDQAVIEALNLPDHLKPTALICIGAR